MAFCVYCWFLCFIFWMAMTMALPLHSSFFTNSQQTKHRLSRERMYLKGKLMKGMIISAADSDEKEKEENNTFSPFKFVTDNPSSRGAIQLPQIPAEDGNVGQMLYMADAGYHCYAPDWLGFGFSQKPQPGYDFSYTEEAYHEEFDKLLAELGFDSSFYLVTQGFVVGSYGLTWALKNPGRIEKLAILNSPLTTSAIVPSLFWQLRFPLLGEFTCQNAIIAERFVEGGSPYVLKNEKADVYRLPYLSSSGPGFALLEATRKASFKDLSSRITNGFSSGSWDIPILVAWGQSDKYLPQSEAETFQKNNISIITLKILEGAGHLPQEDWPEKVTDALKNFLN